MLTSDDFLRNSLILRKHRYGGGWEVHRGGVNGVKANCYYTSLPALAETNISMNCRINKMRVQQD